MSPLSESKYRYKIIRLHWYDHKMYNFSDFIPIYTHLYALIIRKIFSFGKSTLNMSIKVRIRVRRKVTVINHKKMVAIESATREIELMVRILAILPITWPHLFHLDMPSWPVWEWVMACNDPLLILDSNDWAIFGHSRDLPRDLGGVRPDYGDRPFQLRFRIIWGEFDLRKTSRKCISDYSYFYWSFGWGRWGGHVVREKAVSLRHHLFFFDLLSFMKTHPKLNVSYSIKEFKDTDRACEYNNCEKKVGTKE